MSFLWVGVQGVERLLLSVETCSLPSLLSQPLVPTVLDITQVKLSSSLKSIGSREGRRGQAYVPVARRAHRSFVRQAFASLVSVEPMEGTILNVLTPLHYLQIEGWIPRDRRDPLEVDSQKCPCPSTGTGLLGERTGLSSFSWCGFMQRVSGILALLGLFWEMFH